MYTYKANCISNIGLIRAKNEDNFYFDKRINNSNEKRDTFSSEGLCNNSIFCVFDGIGGGIDGEIASHIGAKKIKEYIGCEKKIDIDTLQVVLRQIDDEIIDYSNKDNINFCGTTIVSLLLDENTATVVNVGDSKCYLLRNNEILLLSKDHTDEEILKKCGISNIKPSLTQYLGQGKDKYEIDPYINRIQIQKGDLLIVCSDGLTSELTNEEIFEIVIKKEKVEEINKKLENSIINKGAKDNFTIITIRIDERE